VFVLIIDNTSDPPELFVWCNFAYVDTLLLIEKKNTKTQMSFYVVLNIITTKGLQRSKTLYYDIVHSSGDRKLSQVWKKLI